MNEYASKGLSIASTLTTYTTGKTFEERTRVNTVSAALFPTPSCSRHGSHPLSSPAFALNPSLPPPSRTLSPTLSPTLSLALSHSLALSPHSHAHSFPFSPWFSPTLAPVFVPFHRSLPRFCPKVIGDDFASLDPRITDGSRRCISRRLVDMMMRIFAQQDSLVGAKKKRSKGQKVIFWSVCVFCNLMSGYFQTATEAALSGEDDSDGGSVSTLASKDTTRKRGHDRKRSCFFPSSFIDDISCRDGNVQFSTQEHTCGESVRYFLSH